LSQAASLPAVVVLPEPCRRHQNDCGRLRGEFETRRILAQHRDQLVAHDLDDLLGGDSAVSTRSDGLRADLLDEIADDVEVDVGLEQRYANFAQGFDDIFFGERALATEGFKGALQFICQILKHSVPR